MPRPLRKPPLPDPENDAGSRVTILEEVSGVAEAKHLYRGTLGGDGRPGPIEVRIGRRLLRLIDPSSEEGARLLDEARVDLIGPDGERLGPLSLREALGRLRERLERNLAEASSEVEREALRDGMARLRRRAGAPAARRRDH